MSLIEIKLKIDVFVIILKNDVFNWDYTQEWCL